MPPASDEALSALTRSDRRAGQSINLWDAMAMAVGIVIGSGSSGCRRWLPAMSTVRRFSFWLGRRRRDLVMWRNWCSSELASAFPSAGGDYLPDACLRAPGSLFSSGARALTVMQTGSIALVAFVFGDRVTRIAAPSAHARRSMLAPLSSFSRRSTWQARAIGRTVDHSYPRRRLAPRHCVTP